MSLLRGARFAAIILAAQLNGCADAERESMLSNSAPEIGTHFVDRGNGEAVVMVHGFSQTHAAWLQTPLYEVLVRDHRVIAVDLRGHGDSYKPHDELAYGANLHMDLVKLLDHLDIDKAHFVGFSLGANVVGDLVVSRPDRVQTATMGSGFFTEWDEGEEDFAKLIENRGKIEERHLWEPENQDYLALAAVVRGAKYAQVSSEQIASVGTPTLIVFGSAEVDQMAHRRKQQLGNVPRSIKVLIVDGADHDSSNAAILSPKFTQAVQELIASNPIR